MKSAEGKSWANPSSGSEENVQIPAVEILKAALLLKTAKGMSYILMLLRGTEKDEWIKPEHRSLSCHRSLAGYGRDLCVRTFHFLVDEGLLEPYTQGYNAFKITEAGKAFLQRPHGVWLQKSYLHYTKGELYYYARLRPLRASISELHKMKEYDVFSEYTIDRLVMLMPSSVESLLRIPGMNDFKLGLFGMELLNFLLDLPDNLKEVQQRRLNYWNSMPDHGYVKAKVLEDRNLQAVSDGLGYDFVRIERILQDLHNEREIETRAWIEGQMNSKLLYKGADYFRKAEDQSLATAQKVLGLDMGSLVLSRLYVYISNHKPIVEKPPVVVKKAG
jgi:hypothetical protein